MNISVFKRKATFWDMFAAFMFIGWVFFTVKAYGDIIPDPQIEKQITIRSLLNIECLTPEEKKFYQDKVDFHQRNAIRTWNDAKELCMWLPSRTDRENANYCFTTLFTTLCASEPKAKAVAGIVSSLVSYGISVCDEWHKINNKLYWCEYHWNMVDFYREVLFQNPGRE